MGGGEKDYFVFPGKINGKECSFRFDTDSDVSIVRFKLVGELGEHLPLGNVMKFIWTQQCQKAFVELKQALQARGATAPLLSFSIEEEKFILDTDASGCDIGAVWS